MIDICVGVGKHVHDMPHAKVKRDLRATEFQPVEDNVAQRQPEWARFVQVRRPTDHGSVRNCKVRCTLRLRVKPPRETRQILECWLS